MLLEVSARDLQSVHYNNNNNNACEGEVADRCSPVTLLIPSHICVEIHERHTLASVRGRMICFWGRKGSALCFGSCV